MRNFGKKIQALRKLAKLSQEELAEKAGVARRALQQIEAGTANPTTDTLSSICQQLGVPFDITLPTDAHKKEDISLMDSINIDKIKTALREVLRETLPSYETSASLAREAVKLREQLEIFNLSGGKRSKAHKLSTK